MNSFFCRVCAKVQRYQGLVGVLLVDKARHTVLKAVDNLGGQGSCPSAGRRVK